MTQPWFVAPSDHACRELARPVAVQYPVPVVGPAGMASALATASVSSAWMPPPLVDIEFHVAVVSSHVSSIRWNQTGSPPLPLQ